MRQFPDDANCRRDRGWTRRADRGALAAAQGFEPTIFEQGPKLGGQWTGLVGRSGVVPRMHTNTSRIMTAFSDLENKSDRVYPSNREILNYLHCYADTFGLTSRIRGPAIVSNSFGETRPDGSSVTPA